ncbi:hypothetical protein KIPB_008869 [Kipferlia bialata]|uniref:Uncharacterized protein n=1 Tax=Kipferlia bialata TaxID=797122 RepID=A0A9K3D1E4_9EUKA|nr:hypothetical protein KIPB_008869 [Kipferlia bialata]|eukprot:g8869.t1
MSLCHGDRCPSAMVIGAGNRCVLVSEDPLSRAMQCETIPCPLPKGLYEHSVTRVGGEVMVFGGIDSVSGTCSDTLYRYNIREGTWKEVHTCTSTPIWPCGRRLHSAMCLEGMLCVVGGLTQNAILQDCWSFDPEAGIWTQLPDAPLGVCRAAECVVGDTAHLVGDSHSHHHNMHLTLTLKGGWGRREALPFQVSAAACVCMGPDIYVMGGSYHTQQVHVYNALTQTWRETTPLPAPFKFCRACMLSSHTMLIHGDGGTLIGNTLSTEERERVEGLRALRREDGRQALISILAPLQVPLESLSPSPLTEAVLPHLVSEILSLRQRVSGMERQSVRNRELFRSFTTGTCSTVETLIKRVSAIDVASLQTCIEGMSRYLPVAQRVSTMLPGVHQFLVDHPADELPSGDCPALLATLSALHRPFQTGTDALSALGTDTAESVACIREAADTLTAIDRVCPIPLPLDPFSLSLSDRCLYCRAEGYNAEVRELYRLAAPLIHYQASLTECMSGIHSMGGSMVDVKECRRVAVHSQSLLDTLSALATQQSEAYSLLREYQSMPCLMESDVQCAEYDVSLVQCQARNPRLSEGEREALNKDISTLQAKVSRLISQRQEKTVLAERLERHLIFPDVAVALCQPPQQLGS